MAFRVHHVRDMRFTAFVLPALLATGCVGTDFDPAGGGGVDAGGSTSEAANLYKASVHPILSAKCTGAACHAQATSGVYGFATTDAASSYAQLTSVPTLVGTYTATSAGVITKIKAGHNGVVYTTDEDTKITAWLAKEVQERDDGSTPIIDPNEVLRKWSGCMNIDDFKTPSLETTPNKTMTQAWGQLATVTTQRCANCHQSGLNSFLSGDGTNEDNYFLGITTQKDFLLKYFTVDSTGAVIINVNSMNNAGTTLVGHPRFDAITNDGMKVLKSFFDLTMARQVAGTCGPSKLIETL